MKKIHLSMLGVIAGSIVLVSVTHAETYYHLLKEIPVGGEGGWDYCSVDSSARRLYVSHASKVVVIDLDAEARG